MGQARRWREIYERVDKMHYSGQILCLVSQNNEYIFKNSNFLLKKMKAIIRAMGLYPEGKGIVIEHEPGLTVHLPLRESIFKAHTWLEFDFVIFDLMLDIPIDYSFLVALFCRVFELDYQDEVRIRIPSYATVEWLYVKTGDIQ